MGVRGDVLDELIPGRTRLVDAAISAEVPAALRQPLQLVIDHQLDVVLTLNGHWDEARNVVGIYPARGGRSSERGVDERDVVRARREGDEGHARQRTGVPSLVGPER